MENWSYSRVLLAAALAAGWAAQAAAPNLGSVAESAQACDTGPVPNTKCERLQVSCPGLKPIEVQIRITQPAAGVAKRGTVVLGSGSGGSSFYAGAAPGQMLVKDLAAMGFLVVDRAWTGGWTTHEGGLRKESCRYATLLTWVHDHLHHGGKFVATGNSGGSAEVGYALTTWGRGDILDVAIPTSGPPIARLDLACVKEPTPEWAAQCKAIVPKGVMECPSQCTLGTANDVCKQFSPNATLEELRADSVFHKDAVLNYPKTRVHFLYGAHDCGEPVPIGLVYATAITSEKKIEIVPKTPHQIIATPEGREALRKAIDEDTK
jgi:hypothetical protein